MAKPFPSNSNIADTARQEAKATTATKASRTRGKVLPMSDATKHAIPATDLEAALLFNKWARNDLLWCYEQKTWYAWDGTRWKRDTGQVAETKIKDFAKHGNKHKLRRAKVGWIRSWIRIGRPPR